MCGIVGIFRRSSNTSPSDNVNIRNMMSSLSHRGPDGNGVYSDDNIILGHNRLAIIDLSESGRQPMIDCSGKFVITFNGEIFNYKEIRSLLVDYPFITLTDTEVILASFKKWGEDCLNYLKGQFAFAIWNINEKKLFIGRDRVGEKPFYYYQDESVFIFASEISALIASKLVPKKISKKGIVDFLKYQSVNSPNTILEDVLQLPAASFAFVDKDEIVVRKYWNISKVNIDFEYGSYESIKNTTKSLLYDAVSSQMVSDVPLGAFLSGGIDSSAVVGIMAELSSERINTFSVVFNEKLFDESVFSNLVSKKFNTRHNVIRLEPNILIRQLPEMLKKMDAPSGDGANTFAVSSATKNAGITVALSGLGGDELFAGYKSFNTFSRVKKFESLWGLPEVYKKGTYSLFKSVIKLVFNSDLNPKFFEMLMLSKPDLSSFYRLSRRSFSSQDIKYLAPELPCETDFLQENMDSLIREVEEFPILSQYSIAELCGYTQNLLLKDTDIMGMAHSLEIRVPFFDHNLIEFVLGIPDKYKNSFQPKKLLVDSLFPLLPREIVNRPKMGFTFPWESWLKNELEPFVTISIYSLAARRIFDSKNLISFYEKFKRGDKNITWNKIWLLVVLENWLSKHDL